MEKASSSQHSEALGKDLSQLILYMQNDYTINNKNKNENNVGGKN